MDRSEELRDLAELFLSRCWEAAEAEGLGLEAAWIERVKSLVGMITPPVGESGGASRGLV